MVSHALYEVCLYVTSGAGFDLDDVGSVELCKFSYKKHYFYSGIYHSGIFFWLNSNAVMSKKRFWLFMTLPLLVLTIIPMSFLPLTSGFTYDVLMYILWINAIIAGSDIINSVLIALKPANAKFCRGYYIIENV